MLFLPLLFQRRLLARFREESLGGVFHSDGHSVVNRQNKKADTQKHQNSKSLALAIILMKLCIGFEIQIRVVRSLTNPQADNAVTVGTAIIGCR